MVENTVFISGGSRSFSSTSLTCTHVFRGEQALKKKSASKTWSPSCVRSENTLSTVRNSKRAVTQRRMMRRTALQPLKPPLLSLQTEMLHRGCPSSLGQIHAIRERSEQPSLLTLVSTCEPSNGEEYSAPSANKMSTKLKRLRKTRWWTRH